MGKSESKNAKKLTVIITYSIAVVCLLLGLLLPVFYAKGVQGMLVMQLPKALDIVCGGKGAIKLGNDFVASYPVALFGIEKATVDVTAWAVVLYAFITFLSLIAFIPMGVTFKKGAKVTRILAYVIEVAATLVLSLYVIVALEYAQQDKLPAIFNILVAFGGTLLMLIIQCFVNKRARAATVKFTLFLFSAVALCLLYSFYLVAPGFSEGWVKLSDTLRCSPDLYGIVGSVSGIDHVNFVFTENFLAVFKDCPDAVTKTALILGAIIGAFTLLNYFIDVIGLSTSVKRKGLIFNTVRYGIPFLAAVCLFITVAIGKHAQGLALALLFVVIAIELAINLGILVTVAVKNKGKKPKKARVSKAQNGELEYGVNDYANLDRKRKKQPAAAQRQVPDYSDNPEPYRNPYAQTFGSEQKPYSDPFGAADAQANRSEQPESPVREKPAPAYDPTLGYPPEYLNGAQGEYKPPVQEYNPVQDYRNYQPVQDYQPAKQPVQPEQPEKTEPAVHNVYSAYPPAQEQQPERVYKINTVYQGPTDEFLRKLTNDEKIEFAMIFIERSKGEIGRVPEYAIGGDNKRFFNSVFIYLGRIRGIISDGLLNKMYKEINMFR